MKKNLFILSCVVRPNFRLELHFSDGTKGIADVKEVLWGEMFTPLREENVFSQAFVDPEIRTVCWPNGADFAPEFLKELCLSAELV